MAERRRHSRLNFEARREKGKVNASKKKFMPRLDPSGYRGKEIIWAKERFNKNIVKPTHFFDLRSSNFTLASMPQDDTRKRHVPPDMAEVVDKLNGVLLPGDDVLTQVLGTEHRERTKGVGSHVGYKRGIHGYSKANEELTKKEIKVIKERMDQRYKKRWKWKTHKQRERDGNGRETQTEKDRTGIKIQTKRDRHASFMKIMEYKLSNVQTQMPLTTSGDSLGIRSFASASNLNEPCITPSTIFSYIAQKCMLFLINNSSRIRCVNGMVHSAEDRILHVIRP